MTILFWGGTTWMRAQEWSDPLRLARSDAIKRPQSPAAQFDYHQPKSFNQMAFSAHGLGPLLFLRPHVGQQLGTIQNLHDLHHAPEQPCRPTATHHA